MAQPIFFGVLIAIIPLGIILYLLFFYKEEKENENNATGKALNHLSTIYKIFYVLLIFILVILIGFLCLQKMKTAITNEQCCNDSFCSDTYYNYTDNTCHLVLCEQNPMLFNQSKCVYEGKALNITMLS